MPMVDLPATGTNIRNMMAMNNVTAAEIADTLGFTTRNAVYKWIRGEALPTVDNLVVLAVILNTTIDSIIVVRTA